MKRVLYIFMVLSAIALVHSCTKAAGTGANDFKSDFEPDIEVCEMTVAATTAPDMPASEAHIILSLNGTTGMVTSSLQADRTIEISLSTGKFNAAGYGDIFYLAAVLGTGDQTVLSDVIAQIGGKWILYIDGTLDIPGFIDCIDGFMGPDSSYQGPGLHMHTDLYSKIGSFVKDESAAIIFTIKEETND